MGLGFTWYGVTAYIRYTLNDDLEPSIRVAVYDDSDGFITGVRQSGRIVTMTLIIKIGAGLRKHAVAAP